jgi:hypothetical protein
MVLLLPEWAAVCRSVFCGVIEDGGLVGIRKISVHDDIVVAVHSHSGSMVAQAARAVITIRPNEVTIRSGVLFRVNVLDPRINGSRVPVTTTFPTRVQQPEHPKC